MMDIQIMVRIYHVNGEIKDTTVSHETFYGRMFKGDAKKYLDRVLAPLPKNRYKRFDVFEVDKDRNIIKMISPYL